MKKFMMTLAAVLCCAMTMTLFTACGDDEQDSVSNYAGYNVTAKGNGFIGLMIVQNMQDALTTGMPLDGKMCKRDDAKAIKICDEVAKKSVSTASCEIELTVTPFGNGTENKTITLQTYVFTPTWQH